MQQPLKEKLQDNPGTPEEYARLKCYKEIEAMLNRIASVKGATQTLSDKKEQLAKDIRSQAGSEADETIDKSSLIVYSRRNNGRIS